MTRKFLEQLLWHFENTSELINELRATYPFAVPDQGRGGKYFSLSGTVVGN